MTDERQYEGIAIIGMSGRFPGSENIGEFWSNLMANRETVSFFSDAELADSGLNAQELRSRGKYVPARGILKDADCFDAAFFGIHPKEAEVMDPQQRVFLEACWSALESAGYAPNRIDSIVGVFGGITFNTYYMQVLHRRPDLLELVGSDLVMFGNEKDYLTTRVAYKLGLKGPALNVSTACSTSLVAVAQACQSLLTYQCDVALAGGASVTVPQKRGYYHDEGNIGSADGHTRTFDAQATGTAFGNGVAVVVLKRLDEAVRDGDQIHAVIKGAALNNDGSQRVSFGAPGVEGQSKVIAMAHALAGVDPESISYVEAHGTATPLGDPIEIAGLTKAFREGTQAKQFCAIGSVKSNLGHLDAAAGVTGLIKTTLALRNRKIPASLHFKNPNPKLDLENSPFYVNAALQDWKTKPGMPRRAGVSAFGTGGTNAHVVVEEAPELERSGPSRPWHMLPISAKSPEALDRATANLSAHLKQIANEISADESVTELADIAFTLQTGRSEFQHRRFVACQDPAESAAVLDSADPKRVFTNTFLAGRPVVFMFPGQGAQYPGMGAELYRTEPIFRAEVDRCASVLKPLLKHDLLSIVFESNGTEKEAERLLVQTSLTQPALFMIEYALAKLWMSWGIKPVAMIGHSVGEYVAGCLAGVFTMEDALTLVAKRGALIQEQPGGAMLVVRQSEKEVLPLLNSDLAVAAINSPNLCVVSGPHSAVAVLEKEMESRRIVTRHLHTSHAFHSPMMEPVLSPFTDLLRTIKLDSPKIPYVSNVTARWITPQEAKTPDYWAGHVRQTVRFADGVAELMKDSQTILLEVGPGQTLTTLARQHPSKSADQPVLPSLPLAGTQELRGFFETVGKLWMTGASLDFSSLYENERRHRVALPTYPFERKRYWPEPPQEKEKNSHVIADMSPSALLETLPETTSLPSPDLNSANSNSAPTNDDSVIPRKERLMASARALLAELSGYDLSEVDPSTDLMELGLDSLLLTQASQLFQRKFGVSITFRQLMEELSSIDAIASHLDASMPKEELVAKPTPSQAKPVSVASSLSSAAPPQNAVLQQILQQQQQLTNQILELLGQKPAAATSQIPVQQSTPAVPASTSPTKPEGKSHGPFKPFDRHATTTMSSEQSRALEGLVARYLQRTQKSKKLAAENRSTVADPRSAAGFNRLWKEMVYPIYTTRSDGSKVWDVDGNEYIDFVMGFGASMFGHRPPFVVQAIQEQLQAGFEIGPIQPIVGEVAQMVREFTGMPRIAFTNTGSEAVLAATRVARTVLGRDKIAVFAGAYHGIFDEVLFRPLTVNGETRTAAIAPGVPQTALDQVIVLEYGNLQSLEILKARGSEIAAVLVEPVQSRRLDLQPKEFMHELRRVTNETGSALIFDEVVTGFRVHLGGAQAYFGVRADLATYGKVIGGGMPLGVVAGIPKFMDALDGGQWQYGDTSFPEVGVTFFAGTFVRHPLVMAAAKAVLTHLKENGPELQERLSERTARLADELRSLNAEFKAPFIITQFSSLIHINYPSDQKFATLLFYLLREHGIHIYDNRAFVLTTAHTETDLAALLKAFRESLAEMRSSGFLPPLSATSVAGKDSVLAPAGRAAEAQTSLTSSPALSEPFSLTEPQKEIWLAAQMGGESALAYNESLKLEFRGPFDVETFRMSATQVVERHPILLASISADGQSQQVLPETKLDLPLIDLSNESQPDRKLQQIIEAEVSGQFDLSTGPLLRVRIVRLSSNHHVVVWTAHHIICDGWSGGLIVSELAALYSSFKQGKQPELESPKSFRDHAITAGKETNEVRNAMEYWRKQYVDLPAPLDLPTDRTRPLVRSARASTLKRNLDLTLHSSLKRIAGQNRTTLVVLLMASLKTLLYRLTNQTDLVIGLPSAGQAMTDNACLVGHCVNLLPIRSTLTPDAGFRENLAAVKKSVLDAYDHHQCTIGSILQNLSVPRSASRPPLVEVIFNVDRDPGASEFFGLQFACVRNPKRALHFDLFFNFVEGPRGFYVECDYNTDLFDDATIERWLGHYQTLLHGIVAEAALPLDQLPILNEEERKQLTVTWNQASVDVPVGLTLHRCFELQAEKTPDAPAVTFEDRHLTYGELNRRANQVAHFLKNLGIGPDILVGLCVERSLDMLVGILGIVKAGGAYVPMDPEYPKERLKHILEDSKAPVVLTQQSLAKDLSHYSGKLICLDSDWNSISQCSQDNLPAQTRPENLAYVLFTSGSTGRPKGVALEHRNAAAFVEWAKTVFTPADLAAVLFSTSVCFDLSIFEIFVTWSAGGEIVLAPNALHLPSLAARNRVTLINTVPSAIAELVRMNAVPASVKVINLAGEALPDVLVQQIYASTKAERVYNLYGPTEATTYSTFTLVPQGSPVTIGKPIANTRGYILDPKRGLLPVGIYGELYLAGAGLARGYFGRADLTDERFVPNPFSSEYGSRMYKTGDLCRWLPDGNIQYSGRMDHQVKLRGFRIELGEIEFNLDRHPAVQQGIVMAREDQPGIPRLVGYVTLKSGNVAQPEELREFLKQSLPEFMIPSVTMILEAFPLTPNGKIDRKALPAPNADGLQSKHEFVAPRDFLEQMLSQLWTKILRVKHLGVNDNFFELGGHSLLALRVSIQIEKICKKRIPLATFVQHPTIAELAAVLRKEGSSPAWSSLVPIRPGGSRSPLFLIHSHGGNVLEYYPLANLLGNDQPVYALQARGLDGNIPKNQTIESIAAAYLKEIRALQPHGPYFLGGFCFGGLVALEAARQLKQAGESVAMVAMLQTANPTLTLAKPTGSSLSRLFRRVAKRLDLERSNLSERGLGYLREKSRHSFNIAGARTVMAFDRMISNGDSPRVRSFMPYVLEALGIEHDRAFEAYEPRPFDGNVILFRASRQLPGLEDNVSLGWDALLGKNLTICHIPGHQQNMLVEPHVKFLAERLAPHIEAAQEMPTLALAGD